jgi:hypothetical protein
VSFEFALTLVFLAKVAERVFEFKKEVDDALEQRHPRRRLSEEEIQRYQQEFDLSEEQVQRLRQNSPLNLTFHQQGRRQTQPVSVPVTGKTRPVETAFGLTFAFEKEADDDPQVLERARRDAEESRRKCKAYYDAVEKSKWGDIPQDMRRGLRKDRWGTTWEKNPNGPGWRELGSDDDYQITPNSSW